LITAVIIIAFVVLFTACAIFLINLIQKRKKLMPEFINGKPTILFFWVDDKRCKTVSPMVEKIKENFKGSVKVLSFNVMKDYRIAENYLVLNVPTIILFDKEGNPVLKIDKPGDYPKLESKLKELI